MDGMFLEMPDEVATLAEKMQPLFVGRSKGVVYAALIMMMFIGLMDDTREDEDAFSQRVDDFAASLRAVRRSGGLHTDRLQ